MEKVICDSCGSANHTVKYKIDINEKSLRYYRYARNIPEKGRMTGIHQIVVCNDCQLMFTNPRFSTKELNMVYSSESIIGGNWKNFWYLFNPRLPDVFSDGKKKMSYNPKLYQWKFDILRKYAKDTGRKPRLLDMGCGDGKFVHDAIQNGFDAIGIDLSPDRIAKGKALYGLNDQQIKCMNVDGFDAKDTFDFIVMWDVIEHVESPATLLKSLQKVCTPDTLVVALTMSTDSITYRLFGKHWNYINPTQHLHYFSHSTIKRLFDQCGFDFVGVEMDNSKSKNLIHLLGRIVIGQLNQFFFYVYTRKSWLRALLKPFQRGITHERMLKRLENLYPGRYVGRYHDNFVFIGKPKS